MLISENVGSLKEVALVRIFDESSVTSITGEKKESNANKWLNQAANLLTLQWPRGGTADTYRKKTIYEFGRGKNGFYGLPCSYLLVDQNENCVG